MGAQHLIRRWDRKHLVVAAAVVALVLTAGCARATIGGETGTSAPPGTTGAAIASTNSGSPKTESSTGEPGTSEPSTGEPGTSEPSTSRPSTPSRSTTSPSSSDGVGRPMLGTKWYLTALMANGVRTDAPADRDAWVRFTPTSVTFNGTSESMGDRDFTCDSWTAAAVVTATEATLTKTGAADRSAREGCGTRFLGVGSPPAQLTQVESSLTVYLDQGGNKFTYFFSSDLPTEPTVSTPDLSFLPPASTRTVRAELEANPLLGKSFRATSITGQKIVGKGITLSFGLDQVGLNAGCNGGGAGYTVTGNELTFTSGSSTAMLCGEEGVMEQEHWLGSLTSGVRRFSLDGSTLTISLGSQRAVFTEFGGSKTPTSGSASKLIPITAIDEVVDSTGHRRLPKLEQGEFWSQEPSMLLTETRLTFDAGCGQYISTLTGTSPTFTASVADGSILHDCPPNRSALAAALRSILSGPVTIERDGSFFTFTGRDGLQVTAHSGYPSG